MKIAIIAWGSLIWNPGSLEISESWIAGGPSLPIEFARISVRERLTLVLHSDGELQPTQWALSGHSEIQEVRENLMGRENSLDLDDAPALLADGRVLGRFHDRWIDRIADWLEKQSHLDGVVWTGLTSNWEEKRGRSYHFEDALSYLKALENPEEAKNYIQKAPQYIRTPLREKIERELGWLPLKGAVGKN